MTKSWVPIASCGLFAVSMGIALPISATRPATGPDAGQKSEKGSGAVRARVVPETPILERDSLGQYLNWDLRIGNDTGERIALTRIELSVLDSGGRLALRRFLSAEGAVHRASKRCLAVRSTPGPRPTFSIRFTRLILRCQRRHSGSSLNFRGANRIRQRFLFARRSIDPAPRSFCH